MNRKTQVFFAAFAITLILLIATAGFIVVDLSTERYMPDQFGPFFEITSIKSGYVDFRFLAESYRLEISPQDSLQSPLVKFRGLIPASMRVASAFAAEAASHVIEYIENSRSQ